jgi:hypothetical protein
MLQKCMGLRVLTRYRYSHVHEQGNQEYRLCTEAVKYRRKAVKVWETVVDTYI